MKPICLLPLSAAVMLPNSWLRGQSINVIFCTFLLLRFELVDSRFLLFQFAIDVTSKASVTRTVTNACRISIAVMRLGWDIVEIYRRSEVSVQCARAPVKIQDRGPYNSIL